jgi:polysaccharide export outer membrane protein
MPDQRMSKSAPVVVATMLCLAATGCTSKYSDLKAFVQAHDHGDVAASRYRIEPPDVIAISSPTSPEIDGTFQTVGIDGKVSLKLIGDVKVSRLTPHEASSRLEDLLSRYYVEPKVHVRVAGPRSKRVYVLGQVGATGPMVYTGRDTLLDVLSRATMTHIAWGTKVRVIRPNADPGERHEIVVNVDEIMRTGDTRANFLLQPGDIVYVPPTPLGWVGLRIRELLFPVSPALVAYRSPEDFMQTNDMYENRFSND